jgi:threonine dehydratase
VSEFNYRYATDEEAHVYVGLQVATPDDRASVSAGLIAAGYRVQDMTENEAAKLHVRHMVGGRTLGGKQELLFRFEFPERPGALLKFLSVLGTDWNITMFHYRNHGAAWGRVLVGFEAGDHERRSLLKKLQAVGYRHWEETDNPAYRLFLR